MEHTLATSTTKNYQRSYNNYLQFCKCNNLQLFPLHETNIMIFITQLMPNSTSNIKCHIAAIKHYATKLGYHRNFVFPRLYMLIRAIKRTNNNKNRKPKRIPITPPQIKQIFNHLSVSKHNQIDKAMLWAATNAAFFGFLRSSEYTSPTTKTFDPDTTLCFQDIHIHNNIIQLNIKTSKTDPFRQGCTIRLAQSMAPICPVRAISEYVINHPTKNGPLFRFTDGTYLTRRKYNDLLKMALPHIPKHIVSSHSLRIGAAMTAAAAGLPRWLIQQLGRWNSDCFRTYIRIPQQTIVNTTKLLATTNRQGSMWDPDLA